MKLLLQEIRRNPLLWLVVFVPIALAAEKLNHEAHTLYFCPFGVRDFAIGCSAQSFDRISRRKAGDSVSGLLDATPDPMGPISCFQTPTGDDSSCEIPIVDVS